ncbi:META domain-containing protein [Dyadobacter sp. OTU695]|uniref:META domain-containing protein n=1 Tax=Dyadobacter sp. OTU695 TaxID=3043860 RepID=UPI00313C524B
MRTFGIILLAFLIGFVACKGSKTTKAMQTGTSEKARLEGEWELNYIMLPGSSFEEIYKEKKPFIKFDLIEQKFSGNTSCNSFAGKLKTDGSKIDFTEPFMMTKMFCPGEGENKFVETLKKVTSYSVSEGNTLNFISGDIGVMRFTRK